MPDAHLCPSNSRLSVAARAPHGSVQRLPLLLLMAALASASGMMGCERAPAEPEGNKPAAGVATVTREPLRWTVPPTWTVARTADKGEYRGKYQIPTTGDAKHQPEMLVSYLGKGKEADLLARLQRLRADFEGPDVAAASVDQFAVGDMTVRVLELSGTYKFPLGPPMGKGKRSAATVLKQDWRGLGGAVQTADKGNWFFQLVGPGDAVAAAKADFMTMMRGLK